jgi:hypothetical protein
VGVSVLLNKLKELERELNETHNLKRMYSEFPIEVKIPKYRVFRDSLCLFYQKKRGFRAWAPNHFTRASLVSPFMPFYGQSSTGASNPNPTIRATQQNVYWNVKVSNGTGMTGKEDIVLKGATVYQADSGTSAKVDAPTGYQRQLNAVYNAGTLPANYGIREVGLFALAGENVTISGQSFSAGTEYLVSRFSVDDGDFTVYTVNNTLPLTINLIYQWTLR